MPNSDHYEILQTGVESWNQWRDGHPEIEPDLGDADLSGLKLNTINFSDTDLRRTNLTKADLRGANLVRADLRAANINKTRNIFDFSKWQDDSAYVQSLEWLLNDLKIPHRPPDS